MKNKIIIAEDNETMRLAMSEILRREVLTKTLKGKEMVRKLIMSCSLANDSPRNRRDPPDKLRLALVFEPIGVTQRLNDDFLGKILHRVEPPELRARPVLDDQQDTIQVST